MRFPSLQVGGSNRFGLQALRLRQMRTLCRPRGRSSSHRKDAERFKGSSLPATIGILSDPSIGTTPAMLSGTLREAVGDAVIYTGNQRNKADSPMVQVSLLGAVSLFGIMGAVTAFAAIFVIAGTVAFSVQQRLRELALLRTIVATPEQLRRMLGMEALLLTIVASVIGCPLGLWLCRFLEDQLRQLGVVPVQFHHQMSPFPFILAVSVGLLATQIAAWMARRRGSRIAPTQALRESAANERPLSAPRFISGLVFIACGLALLLFGPLSGADGTAIGMGFIACSLFLVSAALLVKTVRGLIGSLVRIGGVTGDLAIANTSARASRMAGVAMPLALLVALNGTMHLTSTLFNQVTADQQQTRMTADYILTARGTPGLPLSIIPQVLSSYVKQAVGKPVVEALKALQGI